MHLEACSISYENFIKNKRMSKIVESIGKLNKITWWLHNKLNPDFPNLILLTEDGKNPVDGYSRYFHLKNRMFQDWAFRIYLGNMRKKWENVYSKIALENYIWELLKDCDGKWASFTIELCKSVGDILNKDNKEEESNTMTLQEQRDFLTSMIIKVYGKKKLKKINITSLDNQPEHKELLDIIKAKWLEWLSSPDKPKLPKTREDSGKEKFSSIDIARYLYRVCNHNDNFMKMIYETKSKNIRGKESNVFDRKRASDFYWMIEVAIRLTDFLNGITVQWWVRRQEKYDRIIRLILDIDHNKEVEALENKFREEMHKDSIYETWYIADHQVFQERLKEREEKQQQLKLKKEEAKSVIKLKHRKIPELGDIQDRVQSNKQWKRQTLYSQYLSTSREDNQEFKEKRIEQKGIKNKINLIKYTTTAAIAAMMILTLSGIKLYNSHKQKKIAAQTQEVMQEIFKDKRVGGHSRSGLFSDLYTWEKATEFINENYVDPMVIFYKIRYGEPKHISEEELRYKIISCLNNQKVLNTLGEAEKRNYNLNIVLDEIFVPQYIGELRADNMEELKKNNMEMAPYIRYKEYEEWFINILNADANLFSENRQISQELWSKWQDISDEKKAKYFNTTEIWYFTTFDENDFNIRSLWDGIGEILKLWIKTRYDSTRTKEIPYVVAKSCDRIQDFSFNPSEKEKDKWDSAKRSLDLSKAATINYFLQTKPVIKEILNEYIIRYMHFTGTDGKRSYAMEKQNIPIRNVQIWWEIQDVFIKDMVNNKIYEKIKSWEHIKIINYIDGFVQKNKKLFSEEKQNTVPYSFYGKSITAFQNTLKNWQKIDNDFKVSCINIPDDNKKYHTSDLWYYRTAEGRCYKVIQAKVNGQEYIYACSIDEIYYEGQESSFWIKQGAEVTKDFMKNYYYRIRASQK